MDKITEKDQLTFREVYDRLPPRTPIKTPKNDFVDRIAGVTMKSRKTVYCWLAGTQRPDALSQSMIEKELGIAAEILFPEMENGYETH